MANYSNLKSAIDTNIKTNGNEEITGAILNSVLNSMVTSLGAGYQFMGVATTSTNPGTPDAKVFYLAYTPGTYTNFGGIVVTGLCVLKYDSSWSKDDIPVSGGGGYTLPIASSSVLGGVKVGTGLSIDPQTGVLSAPGGGGSFNGGEITQDLWLHTNGANYGSVLYFGDKNGGTGYAYIAEDSDDHLTIYGSLGVTIAAGNNGQVTIEGLSIGLGDLSGVSLSSPQPGQALVYRDGAWKNETIQGGGGGGTVTSVAMTVPSGFSVTGSPITGSGTLAVSLESQAKNKVLASPSNASGTPSFRVLDASDIPNLDASKINAGTLDAARIPDQSGKYVTLSTDQNNISGEKTFTTKPVNISATSGLKIAAGSYIDIGPIRLKFENNALHITKADPDDPNEYGIYTEGFGAFGGVGQS